jgi:hypothetical protein
VSDRQEQQQPVVHAPADGLPSIGDKLVADDIATLLMMDHEQVAKTRTSISTPETRKKYQLHNSKLLPAGRAMRRG